MGVRLIVDADAETEGTDAVAMYDSVTGWAFGPVFRSRQDAEAFMEWLPEDARAIGDSDMGRLYSEWLKVRASDGD